MTQHSPSGWIHRGERSEDSTSAYDLLKDKSSWEWSELHDGEVIYEDEAAKGQYAFILDINGEKVARVVYTLIKWQGYRIWSPELVIIDQESDRPLGDLLLLCSQIDLRSKLWGNLYFELHDPLKRFLRFREFLKMGMPLLFESEQLIVYEWPGMRYEYN